MKNRLAIIGAGPSGLICLKFAKELLENWDVVCYERSSAWGGAWARTRPDFLSTSTKYTTQFACYQRFEIGSMKEPRDEFFRGNEYGVYLGDFVEHFQLADSIELNSELGSIESATGQKAWKISIRNTRNNETRLESFSHVILCSGLADDLKQLDSKIPQLQELADLETINSKKVVVIGGGESAVDVAERLSRPERNNEVFLSLRSGIRVSPRVHPIRNVPSDYLRNRLMLSIHENIRNAVGQFFVEFRIRFERLLRRLFSSRNEVALSSKSGQELKAYWNRKINDRAKGKLFNMFHNKSDDFLNAIAENRLRVIGENLEDSYTSFHDFDKTKEIEIQPDIVIPSIGYSSRLSILSGELVNLSEFYQGCVHEEYDNLFAVGYVRPIIGNIPTIAEMQARLVFAILSSSIDRPVGLKSLVRAQKLDLIKRYPSIDTESVMPVDMFPFCDKLAKETGIYPVGRKGATLRSRFDFWLGPASTNQYLHDEKKEREAPRIYTPPLLNFLLSIIKIFDLIYKRLKSN